MGFQQDAVVVFTCDSCGFERHVRAALVNPPEGWLHLQTSDPQADWFCSWSCLADFATRNSQEN